MPRPARRAASAPQILTPPPGLAISGPRRRARAATSPAETALRTQDRLLSAFETFWQGWFDRRHAAGEGAIELARRLARAGTRDPERSAAAWAGWRAGVAERLSADMQAGIDLWICCTGHLGAAEASAAAAALATGSATARPEAGMAAGRAAARERADSGTGSGTGAGAAAPPG
jgi:hypothetical protein